MGKKPANEIFAALEAIKIPDLIRNKLTAFTKQKNQKIVLSLSGGGAKGVVGNYCLVYLLEKLNLMKEIDEVWGVSAGSMVGAPLCAGMPMKDFIKIIATVKTRDFIKFTNPKELMKNTGYFTAKNVFNFFDTKLPVKTFEECKKPFYVLATRLMEEQNFIEVFSKGSLADAVTASLSVPDLFQPWEIDGKLYHDGGLIENTPNVSIYHHHQGKKDPRFLAILSTCFGKANYVHETKGVIMRKMFNLIGGYRYRLQIAQNELTRAQPNTGQLMINLSVNSIGKSDFHKMDVPIVATYHQLLDKLAYICDKDSWNITY